MIKYFVNNEWVNFDTVEEFLEYYKQTQKYKKEAISLGSDLASGNYSNGINIQDKTLEGVKDQIDRLKTTVKGIVPESEITELVEEYIQDGLSVFRAIFEMCRNQIEYKESFDSAKIWK